MKERGIVLALASAQALFQTSAVLIATIGGLAGLLLAPEKSLSTLPIASIPLGTAIATIPASLLMGRWGRRPGFVIGASMGMVGGGLATWAVLTHNFWLLCFATLCVGAYQGFAQFYRFAAAESVSDESKSKAISLVLSGGVVAAVAGPQLGALTKDAIAGATYAGSFVVVFVLAALALALVASTAFPQPPAMAPSQQPPRTLPQIARQPKFVAAVLSAAAGFAVMVLVMTATPLSMLEHHHDVSDAAIVIQWHVLGMFVPSFFSGWLIKRFGVTNMLLAGLLLLATHIAIALSGQEMLHYVSGLVLLGVGWNFLYVGGSTLLTETYQPSERAKVQALNDFLIVGVAAAASFAAGVALDQLGWRTLNLLGLLPLIAAAFAIVVARRHQPRISESTAKSEA